MNIELPQKALAFALISLGLYYLVNAAIVATDFSNCCNRFYYDARVSDALLTLVSNSAQHLSANPL